MAKGITSGGRALNYSANLDITEALKRAKTLTDALAKSKAEAKQIGVGPVDTKPLTSYQAEQLKIKQQAVELAKQKQEQAKAERSASQVLQDALKQERLAREAINTQITKNRLEQQQANQLAKEQAALQKQIANTKKPTQVSNSAAEIGKYNAGTLGTNGQVNSAFTAYLREVKKDFDAGKISAQQYVAELERYSTVVTANTNVTKNQTAGKKQAALSEQDLARDLAIEKLKQQEATAALKNNVREMMNAKGSLEQRRAALIRLTTAYDKLSAVERNTAAGMRLGTIVRGVTDQIKELEKATGRAQRNVGNYGGTFTQLKEQLLSTAGAYFSLYAAINAGKAIFEDNVHLSDEFTDVQRTAKLSNEEVDKLGKTLKGINTRTSLDKLLDIGFEGGRLGVQKGEIVDFIQTVDQLAVVLKKELPGGASAVSESLGKISIVYKIAEREGITLAQAMNKVASSQLELAHAGPVTVKYIQDFTLGLAGTAATAKLSLPVIEAYGAVLGGAGQIASSAGLALTRVVNDLSIKREKYFAIAQLADANLTIKEFTDLINNDTKAALDLFFKGLKAGNPVQTELADRLNTVGLRTGKVSNAVKILAENNELLATKVGIASKAYEEGTSVAHNFELSNNSLAASLDKIKNSIANAFVSSSFSRGLAEMLNSLTDARDSSQRLTEEYENNKHKTEEVEKALKPLVARYDELKGRTNLNKVESEELRGIIEKIGVLLPGVITEFDRYGRILDINRGKIDQLTKAQRELLRVQNKEAVKEANRSFNDAITQQQFFQKKAIEIAKNNGPNSAIVAYQDYAILKAGDAAKAAEAIRDLGGVLNKAQDQFLKGRLDKPIKKKNGSAEIIGTGELTDENNDRTPDVLRAEIKELTKANGKLKTGSKELAAGVAKLKALKKELRLALGGTDTEAVKAANQAESAAKKQKDLQDKLNEAGKKGKREELEGDRKELAEKTTYYENLRKLAKQHNDAVDKFNNDPKNKGAAKRRKVDAGVLLPGESSTISVLTDNIKAEELKNSLDDQKKIYEDFENFKNDFGAAKAKERYKDAKDRYGNLIDLDKSYLERLKEIQSKFEPDEKAKGGDAGGGEYAVKQTKVLGEATKEALDAQATQYNELLKSTQTYQDILKAKTEKYQNERSELVKKGEIENANILDQSFKEQMDELLQNEFAKSNLAKDLAKQTIILTRTQIKEQIQAIEGGLKDITIPKELKPKLQAQLDNLKLRLNIGADQSNLNELKNRRLTVLKSIGEKSKESTPDVQDLNDELADLNIQIDNLDKGGTGKISGLSKFLSSIKDNKGLTDTAKWAGVAADGFNTMSQALGGFDTKAGYTLDTIGQLAGGVADLAEGLASGDPSKMIGAAIKAVGTLFSIGKKVKEMNAAARKEVADFYAQAITGEREYQDLLRERQIQRVRDNKIVLQGIRDEVALRKSQQVSYEKEYNEIMNRLQGQQFIASESYTHGTWFRKAHVNKTYESLKGMSFEELSSLLSQGKLDGDAKALVERLKELEQKGYDAAAAMQDLAKQTSEIFTGTNADSITDSLLNMFKEGKTGAQDFAAFFKDTMDNAALSIFKNKVLAQAMEDFYKEFDKAAQSGDELTNSEIDTLQTAFNNLTANTLKKFEEFQKISGSSLSANNSDGGSVGIIQKNVTEATASEWIGLIRAQYDNQKRQLDVSTNVARTIGEMYLISKSKLSALEQIEKHTFRGANNTDQLNTKLDNIERAIKGQNGSTGYDRGN